MSKNKDTPLRLPIDPTPEEKEIVRILQKAARVGKMTVDQFAKGFGLRNRFQLYKWYRKTKHSFRAKCEKIKKSK